jgi:hypothetical protein
VWAAGATVTITASVVRNTDPAPDGSSGSGLFVQDEAGARATVTVTASVFEKNHESGVTLIGSDATLVNVTVRDTQSDGHGQFGRGIAVADDVGTKQRAKLVVQRSAVIANRDIGVLVGGSDGVLESVLVRGTLSHPDGTWGRGVQAQSDADGGARATLAVHEALVDQNSEAGVAVVDSDLVLEHTWVRATATAAGNFGDGVFAIAVSQKASATLTGCHVEHNARAGLASFSAKATVASTGFACNLFDLNGESYEKGAAPMFSDAGGNTCGCGEPTACKVLSATLVAPSPLAP